MQSIISKSNKLGGSSFFGKYSKLYVDYGNAEKNAENSFWFGDSCIWIGCVKHSLLLSEKACDWVSIC